MTPVWLLNPQWPSDASTASSRRNRSASLADLTARPCQIATRVGVGVLWLGPGSRIHIPLCLRARHRGCPGPLRRDCLAFAGPRRHRRSNGRERLEAERPKLEPRPDWDRETGVRANLDDLLVLAILPP